METNMGVLALMPPERVNMPRLKTTMLSPLAATSGYLLIC